MNAPEKTVDGVQVRDVPGFDGLYAVTRDGRIWGYERNWRNATGAMHRPARWMVLTLDGTGYLRVRLVGRGGRRAFPSVHRIVAAAWLPNPLGLPQVNHLNGIKTDNRDSNLEWCDSLMNNRHAFMVGLNDAKFRRKLSDAQVRQLRAMASAGLTFTAIAKHFRMDRATITSIAKRETYVDVE
jgi:hypothetical protein